MTFFSCSFVTLKENILMIIFTCSFVTIRKYSIEYFLMFLRHISKIVLSDNFLQSAPSVIQGRLFPEAIISYLVMQTLIEFSGDFCPYFYFWGLMFYNYLYFLLFVVQYRKKSHTTAARALFLGDGSIVIGGVGAQSPINVIISGP